MTRLLIFGLCIAMIAGCTQKPKEASKNQQKVTNPALTELNNAIANDSTNTNLFLKRAKYYIDNKNFGLALEDAEKAYAFDTTNSKALLLLADIYFFRNETRFTKEMLVKYLAINPADYAANIKLAELLYYVKQYDESLKYLNNVYSSHEMDVKPNFLNAMIFKEKGDTSNAIKFFNKCISIDQNHFDSYEQLAYIATAQNKSAALDYFNTALKISPQSITALYGRAMRYQQMNDLDNAIKDYTTIIELKPDMLDAHFNLGYIHQVNLKLYREAIKYYNQAISIQPTNVRAFYNSGICFELLGDIQNARKAFQKCIEIMPEYKPAREALKRVMV